MTGLKKVTLALATALILVLPSVVNAQATYTYTGNPFDDVNSPYTTTNFVSGSFTIGSVLADGDTSFTASTPSFSYNFSDGLNGYDGSNEPTLSFQIRVVSGAIADWSISLFDTLPTSPWLASWLDTCTAYFCGINLEGAAVSDGGTDRIGAGTSTLGTWKMNTVTPVPEPETYAMLLAGLGLMGFMARRRKQAA